MEVNIQYQKWDESIGRPLDYAMNEKEMVVDSIAAIPAIGDHIFFMMKSDGEEGVYKVRSRLLNHSVHPDTNEWRVFANVVLEEIDNSSELIKE